MPVFFSIVGAAFCLIGAFFAVESASLYARAEYITHQILAGNQAMIAVACFAVGVLCFGVVAVVSRLTPPSADARPAIDTRRTITPAFALPKMDRQEMPRWYPAARLAAPALLAAIVLILALGA